MPYKTIDVMFNDEHLWVNRQHPHVESVWFDVWNESKWTQVVKDKQKLGRVFPLPSFLAPHHNLYLLQYERQIYDAVTYDIALYRTARNLSTIWNTERVFQAFLKK